jgi:succinoglycan biosynthesis transport protein ExoP
MIRHRATQPPAQKTLSQSPYSSSADWMRPSEEQEGLKRYVETLRERWKLIVGAVLVTTLIAVAYVATAAKTYEATASILVTPVNGSDPVQTSLGMLRESNDPTRDVQTASQLIANLDVARRAAATLNNGQSPEELLGSISAEPVANSNFVAVIASSGDPAEAEKAANAFAEAAVQEQTTNLHEEIAERLPRLEAIDETEGAGAEATETGGLSVAGQIAEMKALAAGPDPTMRIQTKASEPGGPASPKKKLSIIAGIIAGLIIGIGGAFALQVLDPRLRREAQLQRLYRLPVLARVPRVRGRSDRPLAPGKGSPFVDEAYRTLRATLTRLRRRSPGDVDEGGRVILVTGSAPVEGKTTSAANLAASLAQLGKRVILIEGDLRRPSLSGLFNVHQVSGVVSVLIERAQLTSSLAETDVYGPNLKLLLAEPDFRAGWVTDLFSTPAGEAMIAEAKTLADYVVIDSPPLNEVVDGLPLATAADDVLIVARLGRTRLDNLRELGELLDENGVVPSGFILIGVGTPNNGSDHYARTTGPRRREAGLPAGESIQNQR